MNKRIILFIVIVLVLIITGFICFNRFSSPKSTTLKTTTNNEVVEKKGEFEDFAVDIPANYTALSGDKVKSLTQMYAKAIAYSYDESEGITHFNVYLQNRGASDFSKDAVCVISLYDEFDNFILRTSGVVEEDWNLAPGKVTVVKTQFYAEPGNVSRVDIDFENYDNNAAK